MKNNKSYNGMLYDTDSNISTKLIIGPLYDSYVWILRTHTIYDTFGQKITLFCYYIPYFTLNMSIRLRKIK